MKCVRLIILTVIALQCSMSALGNERVDYRPNVHGTVRTRWEMETATGDNRFQVRNARLSVDGRIAPAIDYFLNTDLCDRGKMKILDAWARIGIADGLRFQAGQFRMPFGVDPFRGPHTYIFANRSFIGKQVCNVRAVGAKLSYTFPQIPLTVEAGAFNPTPIGDHSVWQRRLAYAGKAEYRWGNVKMSAGMQSLRPDGVRINLLDGAVTWTSGRWIVEGEYMNKHYTRRTHPSCHAYNVFADYHMPLRAGVFNRLSFQGRFDGMTAHSSGTRDDNGQLVTDDAARNRITLGSTISYNRKSVYLDLRANYEKSFFHSGVDIPQGVGDRLVLELVLRF